METVSLAKLRVAVYTSNGVAETAPENRETVRKAENILEKAGSAVKSVGAAKKRRYFSR